MKEVTEGHLTFVEDSEGIGVYIGNIDPEHESVIYITYDAAQTVLDMKNKD